MVSLLTPDIGTGQASDVYDSARRPLALVEEFLQVLRYRDLIVQLVRRDVVMMSAALSSL